jgi:mannose-1-phosphate guanylyltransferase
MKDLHLVVMAGGSGTRFWPKSTSRRPKQLLAFGPEGTPTLLEETLARFKGTVPDNQRTIVTTSVLSDAVAGLVKGVQILSEPQGRNTAPCIYWAARTVAEKDPRGIMVVVPSDHYIRDTEAFRSTVEQAVEWVRTHDDLVALGVRPTRPETGYGYLRTGDELPGTNGAARKVDAFVEKPNLENARAYVQLGQYLWNGGMFIWRADVILAAFEAHMPELRRAWDAASGDINRAYPNMTATSIDYGIMEKSGNVVTFPLDCGWDDLGSWTSVESIAEVLNAVQPAGTVIGGEVIAVQSEGNIVDAPGRLVTLLGVKDLIVVQHGDAILVAKKDSAQDIRLIVDQVKKQRPELA